MGGELRGELSILIQGQGAGQHVPLAEVYAREKPVTAEQWACFEITRHHYATKGTEEEKALMRQIRWTKQESSPEGSAGTNQTP